RVSATTCRWACPASLRLARFSSSCSSSSIAAPLPASGVLRWTPRICVDDRTVRCALEQHLVPDAVGVVPAGRRRPLRVGLRLDGLGLGLLPFREARLLGPALRIVLGSPHVPLDGRPPHDAVPAHPVADL